MAEGFIKFELNWTKAAPPRTEEIAPLETWRRTLFNLGLVGASPDGVGFGNLSVRLPKGSEFLITGTQTGALKELSPRDYCRVTAFDLPTGRIEASGTAKPSSESLTHAACYLADPSIHAVIHVHHEWLWDHLLQKGVHTGALATCGTPELAAELEKLVRLSPAEEGRIIALGGHYAGVIAAGKSLHQAGELILKALNSLPPLPAKDEMLARLEGYFNSGRTHISFGPRGRAVVSYNPLCFSKEEQLLISSALLKTALPLIGAAAGVELSDLAERAENLSSASFYDLASETSRRLDARVRYGNKESELELVFSTAAIPILKNLDRNKLSQAVFKELDGLKPHLTHVNFRVFSGPEYCKVTLYDKQSFALRFLEKITDGTVIALGDSAVDIPFLELSPRGIDYRPYYVGDPREIHGNSHILLPSTGQRGWQASLSILEEALASKDGRNISAVISDVDNCLAPLDEIMHEQLAHLFAALLQRGARVCLITGGHLDCSYQARIIRPIMQSLVQAQCVI